MTTRQTAPAVTLVVSLPLPPLALSKNGRTHWRMKHRIYQSHREYGGYVIREAMRAASRPFDPAIAYTLDIDWRYHRGPCPDDDNVTERCAAYRDGAQDAGLVANDRQIKTGAVTFERVKRGEEGVTLTFTEREEPSR